MVYATFGRSLVLSNNESNFKRRLYAMSIEINVGELFKESCSFSRTYPLNKNKNLEKNGYFSLSSFISGICIRLNSKIELVCLLLLLIG